MIISDAISALEDLNTKFHRLRDVVSTLVSIAKDKPNFMSQAAINELTKALEASDYGRLK